MILSDLAARHGFGCRGLLHVGASGLDEAEDYMAMGLSPVIWVEARPPCPLRRARARRFGHQLHEGTAFSDHTGPAKLRITNNGVSSSLLPLKEHFRIYPDVSVISEQTVQTARADLFFNRRFPAKVNTLVTDVQGADLWVMQGMGKLLSQIDAIICEAFLTELYQGAPLKPVIQDWLAGQGFRLAEFEEVCRGEWGNALFLRNGHGQEQAPAPPVAVRSGIDPVDAADAVEGLMARDELQIMASLLPKVPHPRVLETGAWLGRSATLWHQLGAVVFTIDNWSGLWATPAKSNEWLPKFLGNAHPDITPIMVDTIKDHAAALTAVKLIFSVRKADLVFLDADHSYEGVMSDIALAKAAIGPGGVIAGHDIDMDGVRRAVDETWPGRCQVLGPKLWRLL